MPILIRLVKYALAQRALITVTALVMSASIVPRVVLPRLVGDAVDSLLTQGRDALALIAVLMIAAGVARAVLGYQALYLAERVGRVTEYRLRNDFVDKLQWLNFGFFDRQKTGDLMSRPRSTSTPFPDSYRSASCTASPSSRCFFSQSSSC